jgi:hypothetical protein
MIFGEILIRLRNEELVREYKGEFLCVETNRRSNSFCNGCYKVNKYKGL